METMESDDGGSGHVIQVQEEATQPQQQLQEESAVASVSGFYDDDGNHTFGTLKKKQKRPLSNFTFKFVKKIVASHSSSTGFLVESFLRQWATTAAAAAVTQRIPRALGLHCVSSHLSQQ